MLEPSLLIYPLYLPIELREDPFVPPAAYLIRICSRRCFAFERVNCMFGLHMQ